jgi:hypothetical protein
MDQPWTEDSVTRTLINPNYCLTHPSVVTEEKWIKPNASLGQEMGAEFLSGRTTERPSDWQ